MVERHVVLEGCRDTVLEVTDHWSVTDFLYLCCLPLDMSDVDHRSINLIFSHYIFDKGQLEFS